MHDANPNPWLGGGFIFDGALIFIARFICPQADKMISP